MISCAMSKHDSIMISPNNPPVTCRAIRINSHQLTINQPLESFKLQPLVVVIKFLVEWRMHQIRSHCLRSIMRYALLFYCINVYLRSLIIAAGFDRQLTVTYWVDWRIVFRLKMEHACIYNAFKIGDIYYIVISVLKVVSMNKGF